MLLAISKLKQANKNEKINAFDLLNNPEAIGLYFFTGCFLSASASTMSFTKYMELEMRQNDRKV